MPFVAAIFFLIMLQPMDSWSQKAIQLLEKKNEQFKKKEKQIYSEAHAELAKNLLDAYQNAERYEDAISFAYQELETPLFIWNKRERVTHIVRFRGTFKPILIDGIEATLEKLKNKEGLSKTYLKYWSKFHYTQMTAQRVIFDPNKERESQETYQSYHLFLDEVEAFYPSDSKQYLLFWDFVYTQYQQLPYFQEKLCDTWLEKQDSTSNAAAYRHVLYKAIEHFKAKGQNKSTEDRRKQSNFQRLFRQFLVCPNQDATKDSTMSIGDELPLFEWNIAYDTNMTAEEQQHRSEIQVKKYLQTHLRYPSIAQRNRIEGKVYLSYTLSSCGIIQQITIDKNPGSGCGLEAKRLLESMNSLCEGNGWRVGKQQGQAVDVRAQLIVSFYLNNHPSTTKGLPHRDFASAWRRLW